MEILWPTSLYLLGLIPLLVVIYLWTLNRRKRFTVRYSSLTLIRQALPQSSRWRRHLPFVLFTLAVAALIVAFSRPMTKVNVPSRRATILLAIDVSRSMCSTDIAPNRLEAAKSAALSFIQDQEPTTQIGIVAFAGFAQLVQAPTNDEELLNDAVSRLAPARRTAIGSAILESLNSLAEFNENIPATGTLELPQNGLASPSEREYAPAIIVLLTDGVSNSGPFPLDAAQEAAVRGVRVYTIGFGTENPGSLRDCSSNSFGFSEQYYGGGGGFRRGIDEATLQQIADMTGGKYYSATSASELQEVFKNLPTYMITKQEFMEISVVFTAIGGLLALLAIGLSMLWHPVS